MNKSESIASLAKSLAAAQGKIENASKNAENPAFKRGNKTSTYADLAEVLNTIREVFSSVGLSYVQFPSFDSGIASVETILMHESGEWVSSVASAPVSKQDAQGVGSAVTYLRRYSLAAMAGIAQEDDDANGAVGMADNKPSGKPANKLQAPSNATIGDDEFKTINDLLDETQSDKVAFCKAYKVDSVSALPLAMFSHAVGKLQEKKKQQESANN